MTELSQNREAINQIVADIHKQPLQITFAAAGAGTHVLAWLFGVSGASRTMLEAVVPYAKKAFDSYVGRVPHKYASPAAARMLAGNAYQRALKLGDRSKPAVGIGCSAAIATDRPKKGPHHAYITVWGRHTVLTYGLVLEKGTRTRHAEEDLVSRLILNAISEAADLADQLPLHLRSGDKLTRSRVDFDKAIAGLLKKESDFLGMQVTGRVRTSQSNPPVLLSGSFNPLHAGHVGLAQAAEHFLDLPVAFELTAFNADKPSLTADVILDRMAHFAGRYSLFVTTAPTFIEKARMFPNTVFVVGYDTAERILQPRFYGGEAVNMIAALQEMHSLECRFLVAGRKDKEGVYRPADTLNVPDSLKPMFIPLSSDAFRQDISSTEIRAVQN